MVPCPDQPLFHSRVIIPGSFYIILGIPATKNEFMHSAESLLETYLRQKVEQKLDSLYEQMNR